MNGLGETWTRIIGEYQGSTRGVTDLEELLDAEVPCGGWGPNAQPCGRAAVLRRVSWHCTANRAATGARAWSFKCLDCYTAWLDYFYSRPRRCRQCKGPIDDIRDLSIYRPF